MRIDLAGWSSFGLRCPDVDVTLKSASGSVSPVSLIQMPNGTGKTTTLELLNATLSGSASTWKFEKVRSYKRPGDDVEKGIFKVELLIDGKPLTIELTLDYGTCQASYRSTNPGSGGVVPRWHVPQSVHRFLAKEFLNLFIFDGEFADRLLDPEQREADRAIDALCQIYLLDNISSFTGDDWDRRAKAAPGKSAGAIAKLAEAENRLKSRKRDLEAAKSKAEERIKVIAGEIADLKRKIDERMGSVETTRTRYEQATSEKLAAEGAVATLASSFMLSMKLPHALHPKLASQLVDLRDNLDKLKLPENTSAQFFEELVREDECICGRPMDEHSISEINHRAKRYLDADDAGVINALKRDIETFTNTTEEDAGFSRVTRLSAELARAVRREREAETQVRALKQQLINEGDDQLGQWQEVLEAHNADHVKLEALLRGINGPGKADDPDDKLQSLSMVIKRISEIEQKIAEASETVKLKKQTDIIQNIMKEAAKRAREEIKADLLTECNKTLSVILANDPMHIEKIDKYVRLVAQDSGSVGQNLSVGYTFLMSVLKRGNNDFPLVVDSPANPIDHGVRRRIGRLIPQLCSQFVGFTINTERPGFVEALEQHAREIQFITMFRKTNGTKHLMEALPEGKFVETSNAILIDDREYFCQFDMENEEDSNAI